MSKIYTRSLFLFLVNKDLSVGVVCEKKGAMWRRRGQESGSLLHSCHSLLEKAGGFIKPLNPAESVKSWQQQQAPPQRRPEVRVESHAAILGFLRALGVIQIYSMDMDGCS